MSDLRTRIAAALLGDHCVQAMTGPCEDCRAHALRQADAVIRELGLRREPGRYVPGVYIDPKTGSWIINPDAVEEAMAGNPTAHRYVTEWQPNE